MNRFQIHIVAMLAQLEERDPGEYQSGKHPVDDLLPETTRPEIREAFRVAFNAGRAYEMDMQIALYKALAKEAFDVQA
jgi:hypothetical protein